MVEVKIYYHDTDCGGVVYYANYLKFLEQARTEFFAERGISVKDLAESGTLFVVARQEIDYQAPAFYGDILEIGARIGNVSGVKLEFEHEIKKKNGPTIAKAKTITVCVGLDFKPKGIPEEIRGKII